MKRTRYVAQAGVIAALYAALTLVTLNLLQGLAFGPIQLRISEAVTVVAAFTPAAIPGLALGSVLANLFGLATVGPLAMLDVVFGSIATMLGAMWTWRFRKNTGLALAGPVISNALIVPAYLPFLLKGLGFYTVPLLGWDLEGHWLPMYIFGVVTIALGQSVVLYGIGLPLLLALRRLGFDRMMGGDTHP